MKKFHLFLACVYLTALASFMAGCEGCDTQKGPTKAESGPCSQLSQKEQDFAMKLSQLHRGIFCQRMNDSEREEAMSMASKTGDADMAVEKVLQKYKQSKTCPNDS